MDGDELIPQENRQNVSSARNTVAADGTRGQSILLRMAYVGTLALLGIEQTRLFWSRHSGLARMFGDEKRLYETLWDIESRIGIAAQIRAVGELQGYLTAQGIAPTEFVRKTIIHFSHGSILSAQHILLWCKSILTRQGTDQTAYETLLEMFECILRRVSPRLAFERHTDGRGDKRKCVVTLRMISSRGRSGKKRNPDPFGVFDCEPWIAIPAQLFPLAFDLPAFAPIGMLCDMRNHETVLHHTAFHIRDNGLYIDDRLCGNLEPFHAFCDRQNLNIFKDQIPDCMVMVMHRDVICPATGRVLLHKGCCYDAPVYIYTLVYETGVHSVTILSRLIDLAFIGDGLGYGGGNIEKLHLGLLARVGEGVEFVYSSRTESMSINGVHVVRSTPAKILRKIVLSYTSQGQTRFTYRDFINDSTIIMDPGKPNLTVRINRLIQAVERKCTGLKIRKREKGELEFSCDGGVLYREE